MVLLVPSIQTYNIKLRLQKTTINIPCLTKPFMSFQALDEAAKAVKGAFDAAQKQLQDARNDVIAKKEECKRQMSLKCDRCKQLKCRQAERDCKGFLDAAGKWIGGVVDAAGMLEYLLKR